MEGQLKDEQIVKVGDKPLEKYIEAVLLQLMKNGKCTVKARGRYCQKLLQTIAAVVGKLGENQVKIENILFSIAERNQGGKIAYIPVLEVSVVYVPSIKK